MISTINASAHIINYDAMNCVQFYVCTRRHTNIMSQMSVAVE